MQQTAVEEKIFKWNSKCKNKNTSDYEITEDFLLNEIENNNHTYSKKCNDISYTYMRKLYTKQGFEYTASGNFRNNRLKLFCLSRVGDELGK